MITALVIWNVILTAVLATVVSRLARARRAVDHFAHRMVAYRDGLPRRDPERIWLAAHKIALDTIAAVMDEAMQKPMKFNKDVPTPTEDSRPN